MATVPDEIAVLYSSGVLGIRDSMDAGPWATPPPKTGSSKIYVATIIISILILIPLIAWFDALFVFFISVFGDLPRKPDSIANYSSARVRFLYALFVTVLCVALICVVYIFRHHLVMQ